MRCIPSGCVRLHPSLARRNRTRFWPERRAGFELAVVREFGIDVVAIDRRERTAIERAGGVDTAVVAARSAAFQEDDLARDVVVDLGQGTAVEPVSRRALYDVVLECLLVWNLEVVRD